MTDAQKLEEAYATIKFLEEALARSKKEYDELMETLRRINGAKAP